MKPLRKLSCLIALLVLVNGVKGQVITGRIVNAENMTPVPFASIYFDGTSNGTVSDSAGNFRLRTTLDNPVPLIVSAVGYYAESLTSPPLNKILEVRLKQKVTVMKEIFLGFDGLTREEKVRRFEREFLGAPRDLNGCMIENIDDVDLFYSKKKLMLTGSSDSPLEIRNPYLGYVIRYSLVNFETSMESTAFRGYQFFTEWDPGAGISRKEILKNREKAYLGSKMHFIRTVWTGNLKDSKFKIYDRTGRRQISIFDFLVVHEGKKYLRFSGPVIITYGNQATWITPKEPDTLVAIDEQGFFSSTEITWSGDMAKQRMAALLPYDYRGVEKD